MFHARPAHRRWVLRCLLGLGGLVSTAVGAVAWAQPDGVAALFSAVRRDDESAAVLQLLRGVDPNTTDEQGNTALLLAVREESHRVTSFLLDLPLVQVNAVNRVGESPLMMVAIKGNLALAQQLIERRAEVNKPGWTPLHYAASSPEPESLEMVKLLLRHHAYIDAQSPNRTTPLMMAARYGTREVVDLLLQQGADPSLRNEQGLTALDFALTADRKDVAGTLRTWLRAPSPPQPPPSGTPGIPGKPASAW